MFLFAGGGTGGHLFPGIAIAQALLDRQPRTPILFAGSERSLEREIVARAGFSHEPLPAVSTSGWKRSPAAFLMGNWRAWRRAQALVRTLRPCAVIGCGGFASAPVVMAAARQGTPILLLEQNVIPGRATRWLSRLASRVCLTFAETAARLPPRTHSIVTGNPVRREIVTASARPCTGDRADRPRTLVVLGGSLGAAPLNAAMMEIAPALHGTATLSGWRLRHQTGPADAQRVAEAYAAAGVLADVRPFFDDMAAVYREADLVVSRAGATTLAELAVAGTPSLLVPYPQAVDDHQRANADWFARVGAAEVVLQQPAPAATAGGLQAALERLLRSDDTRRRMGEAIQRLGRPAAADAVVDQLLGLAHRRAA